MSTESTAVLVFVLDDDRYCVANDGVANVLGEGDLVRSGGRRRTAVGELDVAGTPVEVLDVARLFGVDDDRGYDGRFVVAFHGVTDGRAVGWLVDDVRGVERIDETAVTPARGPLDHVEGRFDGGDGTVVRLDAAAINAPPPDAP